MTDDADLLAAWRAGDREKGERLFERHFDSLYRFFQNKVDAGEVHDLVQKTFLACLEAVQGFQGASSFRTYLFAIARHQLYHHYRARRRRPQLDFGVSSLEDLSPSPSSLVRRVEERELISEALRSIPLDLQIALELRFWQDLDGPDLARALEIPEGTVRSRLRRGLEALRAEVERRLERGTDRARAIAAIEPWGQALAMPAE